jgi:hypothetical protein
MAAWLEGSGQTAWSGFHALAVEDRYGIDWTGNLQTSAAGFGLPLRRPLFAFRDECVDLIP